MLTSYSDHSCDFRRNSQAQFIHSGCYPHVLVPGFHVICQVY